MSVWSGVVAIILVTDVLRMNPYIAQVIERTHRKEEYGCNGADDHDRQQHCFTLNGDIYASSVVVSGDTVCDAGHASAGSGLGGCPTPIPTLRDLEGWVQT
jgi:hypothetical protein